ncbi:RNA polymerase sigma54 factor [Stenotrophomonas ginsengisoli]|uniref:RNA polymerase sigma-54 factor n=1 Tax=Stenotrophomonas ginsengisoli TaxID=336566 RepID=A0A0R0D9C7_9GAMM|nr:RNA polymerase factor sigma-54 [Stenotrophomonas ginsengisoli]KRG78924.1 RNA polymerase sigma54 factor [Stenotrophomonas ginsengisoli]
MKASLSAQLGQQLHLTPALLQSIRLLQLTGLELELEVAQALESNPLLERIEDSEPEQRQVSEDPQLDTAAFDELPESQMWDIPAASWSEGDTDRMANIAAGASSDPGWQLLQGLSLELKGQDLAIAAFWLQHIDEAGYLDDSLPALQALAASELGCDAGQMEWIRQRLLHGEPAGMCAVDAREALRAQLDALPGTVAARPLARQLLQLDREVLLTGCTDVLAQALQREPADVAEARALLRQLDAYPAQSLLEDADPAIVPDVVCWFADASWRVALNRRSTQRVGVPAHYEQALASCADELSPAMREQLNQARWLTRGLSIRNDTLLRTTQVIVAHQAGFLSRGEEAMAPLTLKQVAEAIGMHESTISRITTGKYLQTPRGTFELKRFFAVKLEGASVSGAAVKAMVRRLIDNEPAGRPLADEAIAGLLSRQGIQVARRTVAKYREQLDIAPARERRRNQTASLARAS